MSRSRSSTASVTRPRCHTACPPRPSNRAIDSLRQANYRSSVNDRPKSLSASAPLHCGRVLAGEGKAAQMKIARLRLERFSGSEHNHHSIRTRCTRRRTRCWQVGHDARIAPVLSPRSTAAGIDPLDVHRPAGAQCQTQATQLTEVEVTLTDLGAARE